MKINYIVKKYESCSFCVPSQRGTNTSNMVYELAASRTGGGLVAYVCESCAEELRSSLIKKKE